jgi:hypothetical protein
MQGGPRGEDIAAAEAALAQQQTRLSNIRSGGRNEDILAAEASLSAAQEKRSRFCSQPIPRPGLGEQVEALRQIRAGLRPDVRSSGRCSRR